MGVFGMLVQSCGAMKVRVNTLSQRLTTRANGSDALPGVIWEKYGDWDYSGRLMYRSRYDNKNLDRRERNIEVSMRAKKLHIYAENLNKDLRDSA